MADKSKIRIKVEADVNNINKGVGELNKRVNNFTTNAEKGFSSITASLTKFGLAMQGLQQGLNILNNLVLPVRNFEKGMAEVNTLLNVSNEQFNELNDSVISLSKNVGESADSLAGGLYQVVSAGVDAGESIEFLTLASRGAVAGVTDTKTAVDGITSVLNAYGMESSEAGRISDILFTTIKQGKTTFAELSQNLGMVVPVASTMGIQFEEVAGAFATLTKSGLNTAMTSTALSGAITELANPISNASKLFEELTGNTAKASLDANGLIATIEKLGQASEEQLISSFGRQGARAILVMTGNLNVAKADLEEMQNSVGATDVAFQKMTQTLDFQSNVLRANWNAVLIEAGTRVLPVLNSALKSFVVLLENAGKVTAGVVSSFVTYNAILLTTNGTLAKVITSTKLYRITMVALSRGIMSTIKSLRLLKVALISSGVGALVVGLGFLVEWLYKTEETTEDLNTDLDITADKVLKVNDAVGKMKPSTNLQAVKMEIQELQKRLEINRKIADDEAIFEANKQKLMDERAEVHAKIIELVKKEGPASVDSETYQALNTKYKDLGKQIDANIPKTITLAKAGIKDDEKRLAVLIERRKVLEATGIQTKEEIALQERLAMVIAKRSGDELGHLQKLVKAMGDYNNLTTEQKIKYQQLMAQIEGIEDRQISKQEARFEREYELGLRNEVQFMQFLQKKKEGLANMDLDAEERAFREEEINAQQLQLAEERFGALRGGFKNFLKQELIDFITAQQIKLMLKLAEIMAQGGATLGASLPVSLPIYGVGVALLEKAKGKVQAFAKGGLVENATLGLVGEAGPEIVAPQKDFQHYVKNELTPMIKANLGIDVTGNVQGYENGIGAKLDKLIDLNSRTRTIVRGDDIVQIQEHKHRGRF